MQIFSAADIDHLVQFPDLIAALERAFAGDLMAPPRHHHVIGRESAGQATHLLMSAWSLNAPGPDSFIGTKIVNVFPDNQRFNLPAVLGQYLLQSGQTGAPLAMMDGTRLTHWRTAAASALAASYLARQDASHLLMIGAGALAPFLVRAHASVRPIRRITLWNHHRERAEKLAGSLEADGWHITIADDLAAAAREADILSCATLSQLPIVSGQWLKPGSHLDLVGAFNMSMRECDDAAIIRARVFVDTAAALSEGGDIAQAIHSGAIKADHVVADLADLCAGRAQGRQTDSEITLFKSIGASIEDLAAAIQVWQRRAMVKAA